MEQRQQAKKLIREAKKRAIGTKMSVPVKRGTEWSKGEYLRRHVGARLDGKVVDYLNSIVSVKYDAEKDEGETLAGKFRVKAYPTLLLLDPDGKEIDRHIGYLDPEEFIEVIQGVQSLIHDQFDLI